MKPLISHVEFTLSSNYLEKNIFFNCFYEDYLLKYVWIKKRLKKEYFTMIGESINFMITGMTIVFLFLVIMVLLLEAQGRIVNNFISQDSTVDTDLKKNDKPNNAQKVAVISAAVEHHIKETSKK